MEIKSSKVNGIIDEIIDQYAYADQSERPWIIGFSGGKDSTVLLTLVWIALQRIRNEFSIPFQLKRPIYVVCNDTMVENPIISTYVENVLEKIELAARDQNLPIIVKKTTPKLDETFWINVIGKGYPVPNNSFRWCTDKLKIRPTSLFLHEQIDEKGEAIVLLGTRYEESQSRERSIRKFEKQGSRLAKHATDINTYVFAPIKELMLEEIWYIINVVKSPWGFDNNILFQIYADASADDYECPTVVTDKEHKSCGQSRFGCWTCTVVKEDKSMSALVKNGQNWLSPLIAFRNEMIAGRNLHENRSGKMRNGKIAVKDGHNQGASEFDYRAKLLRRLLETQLELQKERPGITLITNQELIAIQVTWNRDGFFDKDVGEIYREVYQRTFSANAMKSLGQTERKILQEVCTDTPDYYKLINNLINIQESKTLLITKYGLHNDIEKQIERFVTQDDV